MKKITLVLFLFLNFTAFSQIKFEKGYFISNDGVRTECLIKNYDWENNPEEFSFKIDEKDSPVVATIKKVKIFEIYNTVKYERDTVKIDVSSQDLQTLSRVRAPEWEVKTVFLKVLVDGDSKLYKYKEKYLKEKYLFKIMESDVEQLIYKQFLTKDSHKKENLTYIYQLRKNVNCNDYTEKELGNIAYKESSLTNYFKENNKCKNPEIENVEVNQNNKGKVNYKITAGIDLSTFSTDFLVNPTDNFYDFDTEISLRIGTEIEYVLPFNRNKWSVFFEPNLYSYTTTYFEEELNPAFPTMTKTVTIDVNIKKIALPFGIRHYIFLNDNYKLFLNAGISYDFDLGSSIEIASRENLDDMVGVLSGFGGMGVNNSNYSVEIRYFSPTYTNEAYFTYWKSELNTLSFIFAYKFL